VLDQKDLKTLPESVQTHIQSLEHELSEKKLENEQLREELRLAIYRKYGRSSEKQDDSQALLGFDSEAESLPDAPDDESLESVTISSHTRKKRGRKPIADYIPREDIIHDISEEEKQCACGHTLSKMGEEVSEKLAIIPEQIYVERHIRPKYACKHCEGSGDEDRNAIRIAPVPVSLIPKSIVTPGLLAFIIVGKFCDHLPFYRQEKRFERIGVSISRQDMSNWVIKAFTVLLPLLALLKKALVSGSFVQMDETPLQVMGEDGRANTSQSRMWVTLGGDGDTPVALYEYRETRKAEYIIELLSNFLGFLQADGYTGYDKAASDLGNIIRVGCLAHVRRKFVEASKASKNPGSAHRAISMIAKIYHAENEIDKQTLSDDRIIQVRKETVVPLLTEMKTWLEDKSVKVRPESNTGKAVSYALSQWESIQWFIDCPGLTPDNNACERAIRPFVIGRKNWILNGSPKGAEASNRNDMMIF
jgi:transposase